jgi:hypothetical protein
VSAQKWYDSNKNSVNFPVGYLVWFQRCWDAATKAAEEKFTPTNNARDEILRLLDQTDRRLAKGHVVHVGGLLDQIRAKLSPVA